MNGRAAAFEVSSAASPTVSHYVCVCVGVRALRGGRER